MFITPLIIEQHFHGAYGIDFNTVSSVEEIHSLAEKLYQNHGIAYFFPTLVTDSIDNIKNQIKTALSKKVT